MKWTLVKTGLWVSITICSAAAMFAWGGSPQESERGEQILNSNCTGCHDLRPIQVQALDEDGWKSTINTMVQKGAMVKTEDMPVMLAYLVNNHGPLPDGAGKPIVLNKCTVCHDLKRVKQHLASPEEWADTLSSMLNEGLSLSDEDFNTVLRYLARNFRQ